MRLAIGDWAVNERLGDEWHEWANQRDVVGRLGSHDNVMIMNELNERMNEWVNHRIESELSIEKNG